MPEWRYILGGMQRKTVEMEQLTEDNSRLSQETAPLYAQETLLEAIHRGQSAADFNA
jgi:hypothetical protein